MKPFIKPATILCVLLASGAASQSAWADRAHGYRNGGHGRPHVGVHVGLGWPGHPAHRHYGYYGYYPYVFTPFVFGLNYQYDYYGRYGYDPRYYPGYAYPVSSGFTSDSPEATRVESDGAGQPEMDRYHSYYCHKPEGYYPFIKTCPAGWQKIDPPPAAVKQ